MRRPTASWSCIAAFAAAIALATGSSAPAASSSTVVVSAFVPSATNLATTGCAAGSAGRTDFGTVLPGTTALTSLDCSIQFGSSNDTARLRVAQQDGRGVGMYQTTRGTLDTTFDTDGLVTTATAPTTGHDEANAAVVQIDGRIVTAGNCIMGGATGSDICLARYDTNGGLDVTFGTGGRVTTAIAPSTNMDTAKAIALQADGRIVIAGQCNMGGATGFDICLARYNTNGSLDTSFGAAGKVTTAIAPTTGADRAQGVAVQADGLIVMVGTCDMGGATGVDACLARYNPNGSLDTSFGASGKVTTSTSPTFDDPKALAIQADGRIVTAGYCSMGGATGADACLARYNLNGSLDTSFDGDGIVTTDTAPGSGTDIAHAITVQADGRIVTAGECSMGGATGYDVCLARYNANGSLDTTFDTDGKVTTSTGPLTAGDSARAIVLQSDQRLVTAGYCDMSGSTGYDICLARYNANGSLDTTFDSDGRVTTSIAPAAEGDYARAIAIQTDGRIVAAGLCEFPATSGDDACLAQYDNAGSMSQYADTVTDWDTPGTNFFGACLRSVTGGAPTWTTSATCPTSDGAYWNAVPTTATQIATATPNTTTATAQLRFGMRTTLAQPPGSYIAPVVFDVVAP